MKSTYRVMNRGNEYKVESLDVNGDWVSTVYRTFDSLDEACDYIDQMFLKDQPWIEVLRKSSDDEEENA